MTHPIRKLDVRAFSNPVHGWVAQFGKGLSFPIIFRGATESEVTGKAEAFRDDVISKYEAKLVARQKAAARLKATHQAKKTASSHTPEQESV